MNGADLLASELLRHGVRWIATLCGNGLNPFYLACKRAGIRLVDTHNEQAAAYMADAYARLTGRLGVCAVSSGIAHVNALSGIANAYFDGAPVLLITGASAGYGSFKGVFQEFDQVSLAAPICKFASSVNRAGDIAFLARRAISTAMAGRPGPVHLTIPVDVLEERVGGGSDSASAAQGTQTLGRADPEAVRRAAELVEAAQRPLIVAGTGVFYARAQKQLIEFSEASAMPIVTPIWDRGAVEKTHPNFLGVVGAASGEPKILADADLVVLVGALVDYRLGFLEEPAVRKDLSIVRLDSDPCRLRQGVEPRLAIQADLASALGELAARAREGGVPRSHAEWLEEARRRWRLFRARWVEGPLPKGIMTGRHVVEAIRPFLSEDTVFLIDGGNIGQWAHMVLGDRYPSSWLTCGSSAVVGWGVPGAMAAKLAYPERKVLLLSGDGAFGFTITELESAARQGLPFVAVVANDQAWGIVVSGQMQASGEEGVIASRLGPTRYDEVAKAFGLVGVRAGSVEELASAIRKGFESKLPTVIDVPILQGGPADGA
ncbi:MAG: thiamine pyrophosphate-binding protein [Candidatus Brockarchaeota archaeon]|nr:thiamine pyrophosphate-binding protein [Candidatus Brockarchaeota archaeon]